MPRPDPPWACVINNSLPAPEPTSPLLRRRAAAEIAQIDPVRNDYAHRIAVVPLLPAEAVGIPALPQLPNARDTATR